MSADGLLAWQPPARRSRGWTRESTAGSSRRARQAGRDPRALVQRAAHDERLCVELIGHENSAKCIFSARRALPYELPEALPRRDAGRPRRSRRRRFARRVDPAEPALRRQPPPLDGSEAARPPRPRDRRGAPPDARTASARSRRRTPLTGAATKAGPRNAIRPITRARCGRGSSGPTSTAFRRVNGSGPKSRAGAPPPLRPLRDLPAR